MDMRPQQEAESFVVIEGGDGGMPISMAALDSLGEELTFDEAVCKLREMTRQNTELRNTIEENSSMMRRQIQIMHDWKTQWEADKEEVKMRNEQARQVVTEQREDIARKDAKIQTLNNKIAELEAEKKTEPVSVEHEQLAALTQKIQQKEKQVENLTDEKNRITSAKDDLCRELDQYQKIVGDLQTTKQTLEEEKKALQEHNDKLTQEVKALMDNTDKLAEEKIELRERTEKLLSYSLVPEPSRTVADAVPATSQQADKPVDKSDKIMDTTITDLLNQLQELRSENSELKTAIATKNQEMEALHRKVHDEAERRVQSEHEQRLVMSREKEEHQQVVQQLSMEVNRLKTQQSPRASLEGPSASVEDVKSLKTQVVSLGDELNNANTKLRDVEELYQKQKERMQMMDQKLRHMQEELDNERAKADELITKLQDSVRQLEANLAMEKKENELKASALTENRKKFAQLLQDYHQSIQTNEEYKRQLGGGGRGFQQLQSQVDSLTAQLMAADESMAHKSTELAKLRQERDHLGQEYEKFNQLLPVLKAQCEIYKNDFDAERAAREKMHADKEQMREETQQLHQENLQLKDEVQRLTDAQMQLMRERHRHRPESATGAGTMTPQQPQPQPPQEEPNAKKCPMCQKEFPDVDTLQLHCMECIK